MNRRSAFIRRDVGQLLEAVVKLRDRGNTVVVVEHEEAIIRAADQVIEIGPSAGERGGQVVFQGTPDEMEQSTSSLTGDYLSGRRASPLFPAADSRITVDSPPGREATISRTSRSSFRWACSAW